MTYTELFEEHTMLDTVRERKALLAKQEPAVVTAFRILEMLKDRGGFDHWWEGIDDDEIKDEIFSEMVRIVTATR